MLKNLLEWSKSQRGQIEVKMSAVSAAQIFSKVLEQIACLAAPKNIQIAVVNKVNQPFLSDENILLSVLRNLLTNAIKFSPKNSAVTIDTVVSNGSLFMSVTDQGIGISDEDKQKLFKIEVDTNTIGQAENKGTGLGLIICNEFIEKIAGEISVESTPGKGSKFILKIPYKPAGEL